MREAGRNLWDVRTPMRDGVELSTDLYLPEAGLAGGPYPLVLLRTADNNQHPRHTTPAKHLADQGFAVALQDVRGRHDSAGTFRPFRDEGRDGHDSVEWLAAQDWCTGSVGMMGAGYCGWASWAAAHQRPPHLTTLVSTAPMGGWRPGLVPLPMVQWLHAMSARVWQEGRQVDWERVLHHLPLGTMAEAIGARMPTWREWLDPDRLLELWDEVQPRGSLDLPVLHLKGWYDGSAADLFYDAMRGSSADQHLLAGPWDHVGVLEGGRHLGGVDFGAGSVVDVQDVHVRWFDRWLRDGEQPWTTRRFTTGTNAWRDGDEHETREQALHLRTGGVLGDAPAGEPDSFTYDPAHPVVIGTDLRFFPSPPVRWVEPSLDHRFVDRRDDVVVYTSAELGSTTEVLGRPSVTLFTSSDCPDTDWFVELTDVAPSGACLAVADGAVRARFRDGHESFMSPGEVYEVEIPLAVVNHAFQAGHRIRLSVTSSRFPSYPRNLNTAEAIADATEPRVATNAVHHDSDHPSRLVLPVVAS